MMKPWIWLGLVLLAGSAQALESGERLAPWTLSDQFDKPCSLDDSLQILLVAEVEDLKANFSTGTDADWLLCPWDGSPEEEEELGKSLRISIRCIPHGEMGSGPEAPCILTGRPTTRRVLWARSY